MNLSYENKKLIKIYYRLPLFIREWIGFLYSLKVQRRRFGGVFSTYLNDLIRNDELSLEERMAVQLNSLKETLVYAGKSTAFYRELFSEIGFDPQGVRSLDDIRVIPPLGREALRTQHDRLVSETFTGAKMSNHTSGTTGSAVELTISEEANQCHYACLYFHFGWVGFRRGEAFATFGGHPVAEMNRMEPPFWLHNRKENELMFSAHHLTPKTASSYVQALAEFNPKIIRGFPSMIYLIALHMMETGQRGVRPKGIFTYGETILERQREVIEPVFGCPVYSSYGNGERSGHLLQCEEGNFHIVTETGVVEVLRKDGEPAKPGEMGELVVTNLINRAMPTIRYKTGDSVIQGEGLCKCGRTSPLVKEIAGRNYDFVVLPDGRHIGRLGRFFGETLNIREAQLIQEKIEELQVNIVPRSGYTEKDGELLLAKIRSYLGDEIKIRFQIVEEIPRTPQGKFKFVVSKIPIQFHGSRTDEPL